MKDRILGDTVLRDKVLELIAFNFPYSFEEIKEVYDRLKSLDAVILLCEAASHQGFTSLWSVMPPPLTPLLTVSDCPGPRKWPVRNVLTYSSSEEGDL